MECKSIGKIVEPFKFIPFGHVIFTLTGHWSFVLKEFMVRGMGAEGRLQPRKICGKQLPQ